ncbi:MAG: O-antigen ligase family protein [Alphaproteobacteria bacterium]
MISLKNVSKTQLLYMGLVGVFAAALQVQVTVFGSADYPGLRVNLADFMLPFFGVFILFSLFTRRSRWPVWEKPFGYWAAAILSAILLFSCLNGFFVTGQWSQWAVFNKCIGWFILMGYLGAGGWLVQNCGEQAGKIFAFCFLGFFCVGAVYSFVMHFLLWETDMPLVYEKVYIEGFMANRNALGFLLMAVMLVAFEFLPHLNLLKTLYKFAHWIFLALICGSLLLIASRALYLCVVFVFAVMALRRGAYFVKFVLPAFCVGTVLVFLLFPSFTDRLVMPVYQTSILFEEAEEMPAYSANHQVVRDYDMPRLMIVQDAFELMRAHPLRGAGLGTALHEQQETQGKAVAVIDNSLLWVLTEMGPFGLFGFIWVYLVMLAALYGKNKTPLSRAAFWLLLVFGIFSLFHEILYTRFLWFILGMALVASIAHPERQEREAQG